MMPAKLLLAAGIVRDIEFRDQECLDLYIYALEHKKVLFKILDQYNRKDGSIIIRIVQQYNDSPLIQL